MILGLGLAAINLSVLARRARKRRQEHTRRQEHERMLARLREWCR